MLNRPSAFTLIELALVLVIVSLMTGFGLQAFESTNGINCVSNTQDQLKVIDRSLQNYAAANSRYPKPSLTGLGSSDPKFGYEAMGGVTDPTSAAYATDVPSGITNASGVLIGSLPHATLGLPAEYASDCWGSKFTYAIANSQTSSDVNVGFRSPSLGTIELRTGNLSSNQQLSPAISYVVVSHGQDKYGATPMSANNPAPRNCNGSTAGKVDRHNCDSDNVFYSAMVNTGDSDKYYDDLMVYSSKIQSTEDCPDQNVAWGPGNNCNGMSGVVLHGNSAPVTSPGVSPTHWVGNTSVRCDDGVLSQVGSPTCEQQRPCAATSPSWNSSGPAAGPCTGNVGSMVHGQTLSNQPNSNVNYNGHITASCNDSVVTYSGAACTLITCSGSQNWGPGNECTGSVGSLGSGSTQSVTNTNSSFSGSADFTCNAGALSISGSPSCTSVTNPCLTGTVSWGGGCSAPAYQMAHAGPTQSVTNTAGGYIGSANVTCHNGTFSASGSCSANCPARTENWSSCSGNTPSIAHGSASSVSNTTPGYSGAVTMSCSNGNLSQSGSSCVPSGPPTGCHNSFSVFFAYNSDCTGGGDDVLLTCPSGQGAPQSYYGSSGAPAQCGSMPSMSTWGSECAPCPVSGVCASHPGPHTSQPANNTASGCAVGSYVDTGDDASYWRWSCTGTSGGSTASCSAMRGAPTCASEGLNEGEGNYDAGSCTLTSCCGGTLVTSNPSLCPGASYTAGSGNCMIPCTGDGSPPGGGGCCNPDTDGNGQCGFQCRADGQSSGGNAGLCCSGDSDGNGTCGTQAPACTPAANGQPPANPCGCQNPDTDGNGLCGTQAPACTPAADGQSPANPCGCQNPDTDGNGLCGTQPITCVDECGVTRNDGAIWCPPVGYGGIGDGSRCSGGGITQEYNPSCTNPQPCGGPPPCTGDGAAPGGGGCCNPDSDGNGLCGFQCRADGASSSGNPALCCNGDTDNNGTCGFQCRADGQSSGGNAGLCCSGDSDGNGTCGFQCRADGQSSGGNAGLCCNGDSDGNGTCGSQCTPVNGGWSGWSGWGACSGGNQTRTRTCDNPSPNACGAACSGPSTDSQSCCTADGQAPGGNPCCNSDSDGNGQCGFQCRADGQSSGGNPALCCNGDTDNNGTCGTQAPAKVWQYTGPYATTAALIFPTFDMNCGAVESSGCAGCTPFPAMASCVDGASCVGSPHPDCLMNETTCTMDSGGHTAYVWDRYRCVDN